MKILHIGNHTKVLGTQHKPFYKLYFIDIKAFQLLHIKIFLVFFRYIISLFDNFGFIFRTSIFVLFSLNNTSF